MFDGGIHAEDVAIDDGAHREGVVMCKGVDAVFSGHGAVVLEGSDDDDVIVVGVTVGEMHVAMAASLVVKVADDVTSGTPRVALIASLFPGSLLFASSRTDSICKTRTDSINIFILLNNKIN